MGDRICFLLINLHWGNFYYLRMEMRVMPSMGVGVALVIREVGGLHFCFKYELGMAILK